MDVWDGCQLAMDICERVMRRVECSWVHTPAIMQGRSWGVNDDKPAEKQPLKPRVDQVTGNGGVILGTAEARRDASGSYKRQ